MIGSRLSEEAGDNEEGEECFEGGQLKLSLMSGFSSKFLAEPPEESNLFMNIFDNMIHRREGMFIGLNKSMKGKIDNAAMNFKQIRVTC